MSKKAKDQETPLAAKSREVSRRKDDLALNARHFMSAVLEDPDIKALGKNAMTVAGSAAAGLAVGAILGRVGRKR